MVQSTPLLQRNKKTNLHAPPHLGEGHKLIKDNTMSKLLTHFIDLRSIGTATNQTRIKDRTLGGHYTPAHININGTHFPARWEGMFIVQDQENKHITVKVVAWNGKDVERGKGYADCCAKYINVGKKISGQASHFDYLTRLFIDNKLSIDAAGQPVMISKTAFRLISIESYGSDSYKTIQTEIMNFQRLQHIPLNYYRIRPPQWNTPGTQDNLYWCTVILPWRQALYYKKQTDRYGYAKVMIPKNATLIKPKRKRRGA